MMQDPAGNKLELLLVPVLKALQGVMLCLMLGACASQASRDAETAAIEAERIAAEQEAARIAQQKERQQELEAQRRREAEVAERERILVEQQRQEEARLQAEARAEAEEAERSRIEQEQRREEEILAEIAAAEAERQAKLARIEQLERQIAAVEADTSQDGSTTAVLQEAILVAEELLEVLTAEQAKYENIDDLGNTVEPLAKELISELEARKDNLVRQIQSQ